MTPVFVIAAPDYTHRSAGVRALYRLCHHLNATGYSAGMIAMPGHEIHTPAPWNAPPFPGAIGDAIAIYPEVVTGNPFGARRVVRWALNNPGLLGGEPRFADDELVFVFNPDRIAIVNRATAAPIDGRRVLNFGLVDPHIIHPGPSRRRSIDCVYTGRRQDRRARFPLSPDPAPVELEHETPTLAALGALLRRTRTLYSYDHASNVLREAAISGCAVRVVDDAGQWHDPETCTCPHNIHWDRDFRQTYARRFHDQSFIEAFVAELRTRWDIPAPGWHYRARSAARRWLAGVTGSRPLAAIVPAERATPRSPPASR